jgi:hypothetical protein
VADLRQHPEVDDVLLVTRDEAVSEWLEIHAATFAGDEANLEAAMAEVPASIRVLVHEDTDRRAFGESLSDGLLRREGQPEPHPVIRVTVNMTDSRNADVIDASTDSEPQPDLEPGPISDEQFAELIGHAEPGFATGSGRLIASVEQDGFGVLSLYNWEAVPPGIEEHRYCVGAIGDAAYQQFFDGKPLVLGAGATCSQDAELLQFGLVSGSACVPRVESLFAFYGLDATVATVEIALTDGSTTRLTPVNGAVLFAWEGSQGLTSMTLNDGASAEMVSRVQAEWTKYGLAAERCP